MHSITHEPKTSRCNRAIRTVHTLTLTHTHSSKSQSGSAGPQNQFTIIFFTGGTTSPNLLLQTGFPNCMHFSNLRIITAVPLTFFAKAKVELHIKNA